MKNFIPVIIMLNVVAASAQIEIINGNFEDTSVVMIQNEFDTLLNSWTQSAFGAGVTDDAYSGQTAAYVWNWYYYLPGELTNGNTEFPSQGGTPISFRPSAMTGYYKYVYGDNGGDSDSAIAEISLLKYNSGLSQRDTVGYGKIKLGPSSIYTPFEVTIQYNNATMPDTVLVRFLSSESGFCYLSTNCLYFYIDEITLSNEVTGISQSLQLKQNMFYPNPSSDKIFFNPIYHTQLIEVKIYNSFGKIVEKQTIPSQQSSQLEVNNLSNGVYWIKIGDRTEKFIKL